MCGGAAGNPGKSTPEFEADDLVRFESQRAGPKRPAEGLAEQVGFARNPTRGEPNPGRAALSADLVQPEHPPIARERSGPVRDERLPALHALPRAAQGRARV